ncbi:MAG: 3-hydroxyacyl-ACP dehydratase [Bacteroidota bacterium]
MLINDFFKITNIQIADKYAVSIELNPKHKIYEGHFPGTPVTPGVCLTQMVKETVEHIMNKKLTMITGDNLKFTAILNPEINPKVTMMVSFKTKENGLLQVDSSISAGETNFFSLKGSFKEN